MTDEVNDVAGDTSPDAQGDADNSEQGGEDTEAIKTQLAEALKAKAELTARAKDAEQKLKDFKAQPQVKQTNDPQITDELKLIARGLSDEAIVKAKLVAKGKEIPLLEAIKDPDFLVIKANLDENERKEKAKLGASKGSGESEEEISGLESGATRDEHQKAFKKLMG